jgi:ribonuclease HII
MEENLRSFLSPHQEEEFYVAGVDEAGRGPLAGPVIAAAVILNPNKPISGLSDSKLLSKKKREFLFEEIRKHAIAWAVARATVHEIDQINILKASLLAMQRAVSYLKIQPNLILVDGNVSPVFHAPSKAIIKGDQKEQAISAASIVAKVLRDRFMLMLDKKYPEYGFAKHKGYPTEAHIKMLHCHGVSRVHRKSFSPVNLCLKEIL